MPTPNDTSRDSSAERGSDSADTALRPFVDARNNYFRELNDGRRAVQQDLKDTYSAHTKGQQSLLTELQQGVTEAARRYGDGLRASSREHAENPHRAAFEACNRYRGEVGLAQLAAAQKSITQNQELANALGRVRQSYVERARDAYRNYLDAVKSAWQSVDNKQLSAAQLGYVDRLNDEVAWHAWNAAGSL
jgi:hypothetical protein